MNGLAGRIRRVLEQDVFAFTQAIERIDSRASVRSTSAGVVRIAKDCPKGVLKFDLGPLTFSIPDRWTNTGAVNLFVIVKGSIEVVPSHNRPFITRRFATKVAYFRRRDSELTHVFGAHYDFESTLASHPYFHAQMSDQADLLDEIGGIDGLHLVGNSVRDIFRWVRIPTAQMDFLVVPLQLAADHLIAPKPTGEAASAFQELRKSCGTLTGAPGTHMESSRDPQCFRGVHWYQQASS